MSENDVLVAELKAGTAILDAERSERDGDMCPDSGESQLAGDQSVSAAPIPSSVSSTPLEPSNTTQSRVDETSPVDRPGHTGEPGDRTTKTSYLAEDSVEKTTLLVKPSERCGDFLKKRAADHDSCAEDVNDSSLDGGTFKKTKLFGSAMNDPEDKTEGNYFSRALNRLASQSNIQIRPLSSQKSDLAESEALSSAVGGDDDSRMSWTTETTSSKQLFCSADNASAKSSDLKRLYAPETGEEDEVTILEVHSRLYMFSSESGTWKERGRGMLKLNDKFDSSPEFTAPVSRLVMRAAGTHRLLLNSNVFPQMDICRTSASSIRFRAQYYSSIRIFSVRACPEDCDRIMYELQWRIDEQATQAEAPSATAVPSTITSPWLLQAVFVKPCMLKQNRDGYSNTDGFKFILTCEKTLGQAGSGEDKVSTELRLTYRSFTDVRDSSLEPGSSTEVVFKRVLEDVQSIRDTGDCQLDISFGAEDVFRLQFMDKADADEVSSILRPQVTPESNAKDASTRSDSSSTSSSYKSACAFSDASAGSSENKGDDSQLT